MHILSQFLRMGCLPTLCKLAVAISKLLRDGVDQKKMTVHKVWEQVPY